MLTSIQLAILNAMADDLENLEQIYKSVCLEFSSEQFDPSNPGSFYWRAATNGWLLSEVADNLVTLFDYGFIECRLHGKPGFLHVPQDLSFVWRGWFQMTVKGRDAFDNAPQ